MMKRNSILFSFICLCFTAVNNSFHAQQGFNPLDPLGPSYGKMNRSIHDVSVQDDWVEKMPSANKINFPDVDMPEQGSKGTSNQKTTQGKTFTNMSAEEFGKAYEDSLNEIFKNNQDKNEYAKIHSYDPEQTSDPKNNDGVSEDTSSFEEKKNSWIGYLGGIGAILLIVIPTYFYYRIVK